MHIRKQRLLTPGPTPLYPPALHAMMASDIHHRTEDFRVLYRETLADLKHVLGTSNDVLILLASGTGAMEASVSNLFSRGEKVIVCYAGKFGERWLEITRAFGLNAIPLKAEYGDVVTPERLEAALQADPDVKGVFIQASETSTGAAHDIQAMFLLLGRARLDAGIELPLFGEEGAPTDAWPRLEAVIFGLLRELVSPDVPFAPAADPKTACKFCDFTGICGTGWLER